MKNWIGCTTFIAVWSAFPGRNANPRVHQIVEGFISASGTNSCERVSFTCFWNSGTATSSKSPHYFSRHSAKNSATSLEMSNMLRLNFMGLFSPDQLLGRGYAYSKAFSRRDAKDRVSKTVPTSNSMTAAHFSELVRKPVTNIKKRAMHLGLIYSQKAKRIREAAAFESETWMSKAALHPWWEVKGVNAARKKISLTGRGDAYSFLLKHQNLGGKGKSGGFTSEETRKELKPANLGQAYSFYVLQNKKKDTVKSRPSIIDNEEHTVRVLGWPSTFGTAICSPSIYNIYKRRKGN